MLHSGVRSYCWFERNSFRTHSDNEIKTKLLPFYVAVVRVCSGRGELISCSLASANLHTVAACEWNIFSAQTRVFPLWNLGSSTSLCAENWMDNSTGALMSLAHSGGGSNAARWGCPWRGILSAVGLSLIYGDRQWLAGRAGGAQAPLRSQPQLKANYRFISLWSGWTRTNFWSRPETDMDLIPLSSWLGADIMIRRDKYYLNVCDATTWDKVKSIKSCKI